MHITNTFMQIYVKDIDKDIDTHTYKKSFCLYNHFKAYLTGFMLNPFSFQRRFFSKSCRSFLKYFQTTSKEKFMHFNFDTLFNFFLLSCSF